MQLDPKQAMLLVVDMQNSFCKPEGRVAAIGLDTTACQAVIGACASAVQWARDSSVPVLFTRYVYEPDYSDGGVMVKSILPELASFEALRAGTEDAQIVPELAPSPADLILDKNRPSSFYGTDLQEILEQRGVRQLVVCGVTTNCCVESTVRDASHRDYEVFVIADACAELDQERHDVALRTMGMLFADVIALDDLPGPPP